MLRLCQPKPPVSESWLRGRSVSTLRPRKELDMRISELLVEFRLPFTSERQSPPTLPADVEQHSPAKPRHRTKQCDVHGIECEHVHVESWKSLDRSAFVPKSLNECNV